jgi:NitT/TauT family transport system ATP-binding protein
VKAVEAVGVTKTFSSKAGDVVALTEVDLAVEEGEFVSLIGPSGCGKSTLLRLIADLDTAHGLSRVARSERVAELAALVGLEEFVDRYPDQLSGGMQQRVAIARALAEKPRLLLMDEPFGALDEMTRERLQTELTRIAAETGAAVVFVTHSIPEAVFLSDRVVVMSPRPGRITDVLTTGLGAKRDEALRESPKYFERVTAVREALHGTPTERANER